MERSRQTEQAPVDDHGWWTWPDEGYWQALLTQGAVAPQSAPPADYHQIFETLGVGGAAASMHASGASGIHASGDASLLASGDGGNGPELESCWQKAQSCLEQGELFNLRITGANRGGLLVNWDGVQGFVPASHLDDMPLEQDQQDRISELARRIGESLVLRLIEVDERQNRLVFSERAAQSEFRPVTSIMDSLQPGDILDGTVTNLTSFGAFVDLGGVEGLIHISEISWDRVRHPSDHLRPGQKLETYVMSLNPEEGRIALSLKRLRPDPWAMADARYQSGQIVEGSVTNVVSFGAFIRVEEGLEGLVHVSELADETFLHPRNVVCEGDRVRARVLTVDADKRRLRLSLRQVHGQDGPDEG
jgi:small subunit ribosomal protein S1